MCSIYTIVRRCGVVGRIAFQPGGQDSIPGGFRNFNFILGLGMCPLCSVQFCLWRWPWHSVEPHISERPAIVFMSSFLIQSLCSFTGFWPTGSWVVSPAVFFNERFLSVWYIKNDYSQNNLFIMKSILKSIIHVLKFLHNIFECFTSKLMRLGHFEICILKLIYRKLTDQLNSNCIASLMV